MIDLIFLGTGGSMPTQDRNLPSIALQYEGLYLLFDCGEDLQRQIERAGIGLNKKMAIFISHMHADHILGLPGLLLRFSLLGRLKPLDIFGPPELIEYVRVNQSTINLGTTFESTVYAIKEGPVYSDDELRVNAFEVDHRGFALGYEIIHQKPTGAFLPERAKELNIPKGHLWSELSKGHSITLDDGREISPGDVSKPPANPIKIVYTGDTRPCDSLRTAAQNANILISEAMFSSEHKDLAEPRGHMTSIDAATIALDSNVDLLVLTHYSPRYGDGKIIETEAREVFPNTVLARDLMHISINKSGKYKITPHNDS
jgi:ribonuclease Z